MSEYDDDDDDDDDDEIMCINMKLTNGYRYNLPYTGSSLSQTVCCVKKKRGQQLLGLGFMIPSNAASEKLLTSAVY